MNQPKSEIQPKPPETLRRLALVDGDKNNHLTVQQALDTEPGAWMLECHASTEQALLQIPPAPPQAVLMKFTLPDGSGLDCLLKLKEQLPDVPVLMLAGRHEPDDVEISLMAGANGFLVKPIRPGELLRALGDALAGRTALCDQAQMSMAHSFQRMSRLDLFQDLSHREHKILLYLLRGFPEKEIALRQKMPSNTVHSNMVNLYHKLDVGSHGELLRKCSRAMRKT